MSPSSGQGEGTLTVRVGENNAGSSRTGTIVLNDARVTIAQEPAPCRFELTTSSARVPHTGGRASVNVVTLAGCTWNASSGASWLRVVTASGSGSATVTFQIDRKSGDARSATVAGHSFTDDQWAQRQLPERDISARWNDDRH